MRGGGGGGDLEGRTEELGSMIADGVSQQTQADQLAVAMSQSRGDDLRASDSCESKAQIQVRERSDGQLKSLLRAVREGSGEGSEPAEERGNLCRAWRESIRTRKGIGVPLRLCLPRGADASSQHR
jgi:hypothetical protein